MKPQIASILQEGLAVIGLGLFAFGVWEIYPPACYIIVGLVLAIPFALSLKRKTP